MTAQVVTFQAAMAAQGATTTAEKATMPPSRSCLWFRARRAEEEGFHRAHRQDDHGHHHVMGQDGDAAVLSHPRAGWPELPVLVADEGHGVLPEGCGSVQLLSAPGIRWMVCDADMRHSPRGQLDKEEGVDLRKEQSGDWQDITGPDIRGTGAQDGGPRLALRMTHIVSRFQGHRGIPATQDCQMSVDTDHHLVWRRRGRAETRRSLLLYRIVALFVRAALPRL